MKASFADVLALSGFGTFALGLWLVYPPASVMFAGAMQFALGVVLAARDAKVGGKR